MDEDKLKEVLEAVQELNVKYYINSGFALNLRGLGGDLDDCDIRIFHDNLKDVQERLSEALPYEIRLRGPLNFEGGKYLTDCIEFDNGISFDVYGRMEFLCDFGRFEFPFNEEAFNDVGIITSGCLNLPVASAENLLLYYLALRRGEKDGKRDEERIAEIIASDQFNRAKFSRYVSGLKEAEAIKRLYNERSSDKI